MNRPCVSAIDFGEVFQTVVKYAKFVNDTFRADGIAHFNIVIVKLNAQSILVFMKYTIHELNINCVPSLNPNKSPSFNFFSKFITFSTSSERIIWSVSITDTY